MQFFFIEKQNIKSEIFTVLYMQLYYHYNVVLILKETPQSSTTDLNRNPSEERDYV